IGGDDAFSSVAAQLLQGGIGAVIAMSAPFLVISAMHYVKEFYRAVAVGVSIPEAQRRGRQALEGKLGRHTNPRLSDKPGESEELQDWWVPHFYQQYSVTLQPIHLSPNPEQPTISSSLLNEGMPNAPHYG